jgi:hypothetical protein
MSFFMHLKSFNFLKKTMAIFRFFFSEFSHNGNKKNQNGNILYHIPFIVIKNRHF